MHCLSGHSNILPHWCCVHPYQTLHSLCFHTPQFKLGLSISSFCSSGFVFVHLYFYACTFVHICVFLNLCDSTPPSDQRAGLGTPIISSTAEQCISIEQSKSRALIIEQRPASEHCMYGKSWESICEASLVLYQCNIDPLCYTSAILIPCAIPVQYW